MAEQDAPSYSDTPRDSLEATPLLFDQPNETGQDNSMSLELRTDARHKAPRNIRLLTWISLFFSIATLALAITINIVHSYYHSGYYPPRAVLEGQKAILVLVCLPSISRLMRRARLLTFLSP